MDYVNQASAIIKETFDPNDIKALSDKELQLLVLGCATGIEKVMTAQQAIQPINTKEISESSYNNGYDKGYADGMEKVISELKAKMDSLPAFRM